MKNDDATRNSEAKVPDEREPINKASGKSNEPRPDVDDPKRKQRPEVKGQSERTPKQENL